MPGAVHLQPAGSGVQSNPFVELAAIVQDLEARGGSVDEYSPVIAEHMLSLVIDNFEQERGFVQGPWPPLSPETLRRRRASSSPQMLRDTGVMFGSLTAHAEGNVAEVFTNVPYAKFHVSKEPRRVIPLRDFFDIDQDGLADYATELLLGGVIEGGGASA